MALASLAEDVEKTPRPAGNCAVCRALATIPPDEAAGLRALMANKKLRYTEISDMIAADPDTPLTLSGDALGKHARGACAANEKLR